MLDIHKLTIGADPELAAFSPKRHIQIKARQLIEDEGRELPFGLDGNASIFELRPDPANDPLNLALHLPTGAVFFAITKEMLREALPRREIYMNFFTGQPVDASDYLVEEAPTDTILIVGRGNVTQIPFVNRISQWNYTNNYSYPEYDYPEEKKTKKQAKLFLPGQEKEPATIKKPSRYASDRLLARLEELLRQRQRGIAWLEEQAKEWQRIANTLEHRKLKTKERRAFSRLLRTKNTIDNLN